MPEAVFANPSRLVSSRLVPSRPVQAGGEQSGERVQSANSGAARSALLSIRAAAGAGAVGWAGKGEAQRAARVCCRDHKPTNEVRDQHHTGPSPGWSWRRWAGAEQVHVTWGTGEAGRGVVGAIIMAGAKCLHL